MPAIFLCRFEGDFLAFPCAQLPIKMSVKFFYIYDKFDCIFRKESSFLLLLGELILNMVLLPSNKTLSFAASELLFGFSGTNSICIFSTLISHLKEDMRKKKVF